MSLSNTNRNFKQHRILTIQSQIAWSKLGFIAYATANGTKVGLRQMQCAAADRKWTLGPETIVDRIQVHPDQPIMHLSFSPSGIELVVIDNCGRIWIAVTTVSLGLFKVSREPSQDREDDLNQVVGMFWLGQEKQVCCDVCVNKYLDACSQLI